MPTPSSAPHADESKQAIPSLLEWRGSGTFKNLQTEMSASPGGELEPIRLRSGAGLEADILPYGARLAALRVPSSGEAVDVVLGYPAVADFLTDRGYLGAAIGRVSGRIGGAGFTLHGERFRLEANAGSHHLHGGTPGLHGRVWKTLAFPGDGQVVLATHLPAMESGYPGNLTVQFAFTLRGLTLLLEMTAVTDAPTPVALTYHPYFNLGGGAGDCRDHVLQLAADHWLELDDTLIPTGRRLPVADTPFDFRVPARPATRLPSCHPQLHLAQGFDHTFVLDAGRRWDARLAHPATGLTLEVFSDQSGLQFYAGQWLEPGGSARWRAGDGLCLEPQGFPDAVNRPDFPAPWLLPGEVYRKRIRYAFSGGTTT
jgi:aldose 1-epimerase